MNDSPFMLRPYGEPGDIDFVIGHMLRQVYSSRFGYERRKSDIAEDFAPMFEDLLSIADTRIVCDVDKLQICYGFISTIEIENKSSGQADLILGSCVKKNVGRNGEDFALEVCDLLIGDMRERSMGFVFDLTDFRWYKVVPNHWYFSPELMLQIWKQRK